MIIRLKPLLFAAIALSVYCRAGSGAFVFNITQQGLNVSVTGAGTLNISSLIPGNSGSGNEPGIQPDQSFLDAGPISSSLPAQTFSHGISGPTQFGSGDFRYQASSGSGDIVALVLGTTLILPGGYISGTTLSDSSVFPNETISYIGMTPGTYVYTWGSGATADSLTINIGTVPEPASLALLSVPTALALLRRRRGLVAGAGNG
jgi:hypothetical protein